MNSPEARGAHAAQALGANVSMVLAALQPHSSGSLAAAAHQARIRPPPDACCHHDSGFGSEGSRCSGLRSWPHRSQPVQWDLPYVTPSCLPSFPDVLLAGRAVEPHSRTPLFIQQPLRASVREEWCQVAAAGGDPLPTNGRSHRGRTKCPMKSGPWEASSALSHRARWCERKRAWTPTALSSAREESLPRGSRARGSEPRPGSGFLCAQRGRGRGARRRRRQRSQAGAPRGCWVLPAQIPRPPPASLPARRWGDGRVWKVRESTVHESLALNSSSRSPCFSPLFIIRRGAPRKHKH